MLLSWKLVWQDGLVGGHGAGDNEEFLEIFHKCLFSRYFVSMVIVWPLILVNQRFNLFFAWGEPNITPYVATNGEEKTWKDKDGLIPHGDMLLIATLPLAEAKEKALQLDNCVGFCFMGATPKDPSTPVTCNFKSGNDLGATVVFKDNLKDTWTSFLVPEVKKKGIQECWGCCCTWCDLFTVLMRDLLKIGLWKIQRQQFETAAVQAMQELTKSALTADMKSLAEAEDLRSMNNTFFRFTVNRQLAQ
jgi:hypothetical protein